MTADLHVSVLLDEAVTALAIVPNGLYIDGTFGRGGHSREILARLGREGRLLAVDKDRQAQGVAEKEFASDERFSFERGSFAMVKSFAQSRGWLGRINGILLDLGVSSPQLDDAVRGFSFLRDGPLDMRMDSTQGMTAADWLRRAGVDEIARVLKEYGEERYARRIAKAIVRARDEAPLETTARLAEIVAGASPSREPGKHPATRSFQAIRIYINRELEDLQQFLAGVYEVLAPGGRLAIISFHSLEDRLVKQFIRRQQRRDDIPRGLPVTADQYPPRMRAVGKAIVPAAAELEQNPRARSAVLRIAEKMA